MVTVDTVKVPRKSEFKERDSREIAIVNTTAGMNLQNRSQANFKHFGLGDFYL